MPCRDDPDELAQGILSILNNEGKQMAFYKANQAILLRVVFALIFHVRQTEQFHELRKVNLAPLQNLLPFSFIPSNPHSTIVEKLYLFATMRRVMDSGRVHSSDQEVKRSLLGGVGIEEYNG